MQRCPQSQRESATSDTLTVTHESPARESQDTRKHSSARPSWEAGEAAAIAAGTRPRVCRLRMHRSLGAWGNALAEAQARRRSSPSAIQLFIADPPAKTCVTKVPLMCFCSRPAAAALLQRCLLPHALQRAAGHRYNT